MTTTTMQLPLTRREHRLRATAAIAVVQEPAVIDEPTEVRVQPRVVAKPVRELGWHFDPGTRRLRYWDGRSWHVPLGATQEQPQRHARAAPSGPETPEWVLAPVPKRNRAVPFVLLALGAVTVALVALYLLEVPAAVQVLTPTAELGGRLVAWAIEAFQTVATEIRATWAALAF